MDKAKTAAEEAKAVSNVEIATTAKVGIVKPDGETITIDEDGTIRGQSKLKTDGKTLGIDENGILSVNLDGTTITLDEAKKVIKLADTLKDAINGAFPAAKVANNQITTEAGFALDARQANPNIDGSLAKQLSDLNGSLKIKIVQWTPYCPRTDFADKVKLSEAMALRYGSLVICAIRIDLSENTPGEYVSIVNLPTKLFTGINQTNMDGKEGKWYLDKNTASVFLRSVFEAGTYWLNFMYLEAE